MTIALFISSSIVYAQSAFTKDYCPGCPDTAIQSIGANLNKKVYYPGDTLIASFPAPQNNTTYTMRIDNLEGKASSFYLQNSTLRGGTVVFLYKIPSNLPFGRYEALFLESNKIIVEIQYFNVTGENLNSNETKVPEFPLAAIILVISFASSLIFYRIKFKL